MNHLSFQSIVFVLFLMANFLKPLSVNAQVPQLLNYQGVARDGKGNPLANQTLNFKISLLPAADAMVAEYEESQTVRTNEFGLYTLQIGKGTALSGSMKSVKWETGNKYIKVAIDPNGGTQFADAGTTQLLSVPYAIYADKAGTASDHDKIRTGAVNSNVTHIAGDVNYLTKFTALNTIGKSTVFDNGTSVGIGTASPSPLSKLHLLTNAGNIEHVRMQNTNPTGFGKFVMYNDVGSNYATFTKYGSTVPGGYPGIAASYPYANMLAFGNNNGPFLLANSGNVGIGIVNGGTTKLYFNAQQTTGYLGLGGSFNPAANVHINNGSTGDTLRITNATTGHLFTDGLEIRNTGNTATIMNRENSTLSLGSNNISNVTIDAGGRMGIGTNLPAGSAALELRDSSKGFLMPRMSTAQRDLIAAPAVGLQIINLDDQCIDMYDGANWIKTCGMKIVGVSTDLAHPTPNSWAQKASVSNGNFLDMMDAVAFSINGKGYLGTGSANLFASPFFFQYDTATNAWTQKANYGGGARLGAVGFAINNTGYIGTGRDNNSLKNDFWKYNPLTNTWTVLAPFGGSPRLHAIGFSVGGKGYIGTGFDGVLKNDFWEYNPLTSNWTQLSDFPGGPRYSAIGMGINGKGYIGTGADSNQMYNDLWEFDPLVNTWAASTSMTGNPRFNAAAFTIGNLGYVGAGNDINGESNEFYEFNPATSIWTQKATFPGNNRDGAAGFSIANKGFFVTGSNTSHLWEYMDNNVTGTAYSSNAISTAGNSVSDGAWTLMNNTVYSSHSGTVGIGTSFPTSKLSVNGSADKPGGGSWGTFSDMRLKQGITNFNEGLKELLQIHPVKYHYNETSGYDTKPEYIGIIAQDLQKICPYMISTFEKEGQEYLKVDNSAMTYMLINAVKEQQQMIKEQQLLIEAQMKINAEYKLRLEALEKK